MSLTLDLRNDSPALDFRAEIPEGIITALVGPSGSGKTSILRSIAGILRLRRANVAFRGEKWDGPSRHWLTRERPIGFVPQHYGLFPHMTVIGNVEIALSHLPARERLSQAQHFLAVAHVEELASRYPRELSGGQKQRVALARAIARKPQVLLLDEPFSAVDHRTRKDLYLELRRLHEQLKTTIILVTHDLDEAAQLASYLILVRDGRLLQAGSTGEVLTRPRCAAAASLLDIPNVFESRVEPSSSKELLLRWGPHTLRAIATPPEEPMLRWAVLPHNVMFVRKDKPWGKHLENPLPALVEEVIELGIEAVVWLRPQGLSEARLQMRLPTRAVRRYTIEPGEILTISLRTADIIPLESSDPVQQENGVVTPGCKLVGGYYGEVKCSFCT